MAHDRIKAAIRSRMAEAGENYTRARRHVLAERKAQLKQKPAGPEKPAPEPSDPMTLTGDSGGIQILGVPAEQIIRAQDTAARIADQVSKATDWQNRAEQIIRAQDTAARIADQVSRMTYGR